MTTDRVLYVYKHDIKEVCSEIPLGSLSMENFKYESYNMSFKFDLVIFVDGYSYKVLKSKKFNKEDVL